MTHCHPASPPTTFVHTPLLTHAPTPTHLPRPHSYLPTPQAGISLVLMAIPALFSVQLAAQLEAANGEAYNRLLEARHVVSEGL